MKDLSLVSKEEQLEFFDSVDFVFFDIDGVLWTVIDPIENANHAVKLLEKMGKRIAAVTNNSTSTPEQFQAQFSARGFDFDRNSIVTPAFAIAAYLQKINFDRKLFVVGMTALKSILTDAGFELVNSKLNDSCLSTKEFILATEADNEDVGAVIFDADLNMNYQELQKACTYLEKPDVLFLAGTSDKKVPVSKTRSVILSGFFLQILQEMTGKSCVSLAKPDKNFGDFLVEHFKVTDRSRVLFVGDSIPSDMGCAAHAGFKKLLVLSGHSKIEDVRNWGFDENFKPDYYVESLGKVFEILENNLQNEVGIKYPPTL